jgi:hypothetical protein
MMTFEDIEYLDEVDEQVEDVYDDDDEFYYGPQTDFFNSDRY